jgi:hypothetical protein
MSVFAVAGDGDEIEGDLAWNFARQVSQMRTLSPLL